MHNGFLLPFFFQRAGQQPVLATDLLEGDEIVVMAAIPVDIVEDPTNYRITMLGTSLNHNLYDLLGPPKSFKIQINNFTSNIIVTVTCKDAQDIPYSNIRDVVVSQHHDPSKRFYFIHARGCLSQKEKK